MLFDPLFESHTESNLLAKAIVDTIREPLLVLDQDLQIIVASRSFYLTFKTTKDATQGCKFHELDAGVWDIPDLLQILEKIVPDHGIMDGFEVEREFPRIGQRTILLNARKVFYEGNGHTTILLGLEDATARRTAERALQKALKQQEMLVAEMSHRVANSLQIIASILLLKARTVQSDETRLHLQDAHRRVLSVAAVQQQLHASVEGEQIGIGRYLTKLCETLAASMIEESRPISISVVAGAGTMISSSAVSLGLIVTELVINALKHAFPESKKAGHVVVGYEIDGTNWRLSVSDDGVGMPNQKPAVVTGLGTALMKALAQQMDAQIDIATGPTGTTVSVTHATFTPRVVEA